MADVVEAVRQPSTETALWLYRHEHEWREVAATLAPSGVWHPVFECDRCSDVIEDIHIDATTGKEAYR